MSGLVMLGLDPGLTSFGYAVAEVNLAARRIERVLDLGVLTTHRETLATVRRSSDDLRRARSLMVRLRALATEHKVALAAAEMATTSKYKRISLNFGIMIGLLAGLELEVIELLPRDIKLAVAGDEQANKADIARWAVQQPVAPEAWPTALRGAGLTSLRDGRKISRRAEHQADALAAIHAALASPQLGEALALHRSLASCAANLTNQLKGGNHD